jgi:hypothetical protein
MHRVVDDILNRSSIAGNIISERHCTGTGELGISSAPNQHL